MPLPGEFLHGHAVREYLIIRYTIFRKANASIIKVDIAADIVTLNNSIFILVSGLTLAVLPPILLIVTVDRKKAFATITDSMPIFTQL